MQHWDTTVEKINTMNRIADETAPRCSESRNVHSLFACFGRSSRNNSVDQQPKPEDQCHIAACLQTKQEHPTSSTSFVDCQLLSSIGIGLTESPMQAYRMGSRTDITNKSQEESICTQGLRTLRVLNEQLRSLKLSCQKKDKLLLEAFSRNNELFADNVKMQLRCTQENINTAPDKDFPWLLEQMDELKRIVNFQQRHINILTEHQSVQYKLIRRLNHQLNQMQGTKLITSSQKERVTGTTQEMAEAKLENISGQLKERDTFTSVLEIPEQQNEFEIWKQERIIGFKLEPDIPEVDEQALLEDKTVLDTDAFKM